MRPTSLLRHAVVLGFLLLIAISWACIAVPMLSHPGRCIGVDSIEYIALARQLAEEGTFRAVQGEGGPEVYRTPGYPLFLAVLQPWRSAGRLRATLLVQLLLVGCCGALLADAIKKLHVAGLWGSLATSSLLVLNPVLLVLSLQLLTESLFVFLCCVGLWALVRATLRTGVGFALVSGLAFGAAALTRPIGLLLLLAIPASLLVTMVLSRLPSCSASPRTPTWRVFAVWTLAAGLLPAGWTARNGVQASYWGLSKTAMSYVASAYGEEHLTQGDRRVRQTGYDNGEETVDAALGILSTVALHPREALVNLLSGLGRTALGPGEWTMRRAVMGHHGDREDETPVFRIETSSNGGWIPRDAAPVTRVEPRTPGVWMLLLWSIGITGMGYVLIALAVVRHFAFGHWLFALALMGACALFVASAGYTAYARFRVPILPFLVIGADFGWPALDRVRAAALARILRSVPMPLRPPRPAPPEPVL